MADRAGERRPGVQLPALDQPYLDAVARGAGDALAALVLAEESWVHRRVETLDVLSEEIVRPEGTERLALPVIVAREREVALKLAVLSPETQRELTIEVDLPNGSH